MKLWTILCIAAIYLGKSVNVFAGLDIVPFGQFPTRLPENAAPTRDRSRYRHNFQINPIVRTAANNQTFPPIIWDLASNSYPVDFFLYTKDNPYHAEEINVNNASDSKFFDRGKPTKFVIHDFMQSTQNPMIHDVKDAYMNKKQSYNVFLVDWEPARSYTYTVAVTVTEYVGKMSARVVQSLKIDPSTIHVIGFGLGAHAAGVMGNDIKQQNRTTLARITGLDPSLPLFRMAGSYFKLDPEDAAFVDVIHTDGGDNLWNSNHLGMGQECGHVDIFPNRGIFQPGCRQSALPSYDALHCSHVRALEIFKESIQDELSFVGCRCSTWTDFMESKCDCNHELNRILVGESCPTSAFHGNYYLVTEEAPPFGLGGKGTRPVLTRGADPGSAVQNFFSPNGGGLIQGIGQLAHIFTAPVKPFLNTLVRNAQSLSNLNLNNNPAPQYPTDSDGGHNPNSNNENDFVASNEESSNNGNDFNLGLMNNLLKNIMNINRQNPTTTEPAPPEYFIPMPM